MSFAQYLKKIQLQNLNYWNVDSQEAYFSAIEGTKDLKNRKNKTISTYYEPNPLTWISYYHRFK